MGFRAVERRAVKGRLDDFFIGQWNVEAAAKLAQLFFVHLFLLMRDIAAFAGFAQAVAFDRLRENDRRRAFVFHRRFVGGVNFHGIVTAAQQLANLVVGEMIHHLQQFGIFAKKMLAGVTARLDRIFLIIAVHRFFHAFEQQTALSSCANSGSQSEPQMTLMTFQPAPRKSASSS